MIQYHLHTLCTVLFSVTLCLCFGTLRVDTMLVNNRDPERLPACLAACLPGGLPGCVKRPQADDCAHTHAITYSWFRVSNVFVTVVFCVLVVLLLQIQLTSSICIHLPHSCTCLCIIRSSPPARQGQPGSTGFPWSVGPFPLLPPPNSPTIIPLLSGVSAGEVMVSMDSSQVRSTPILVFPRGHTKMSLSYLRRFMLDPRQSLSLCYSIPVWRRCTRAQGVLSPVTGPPCRPLCSFSVGCSAIKSVLTVLKRAASRGPVAVGDALALSWMIVVKGGPR